MLGQGHDSAPGLDIMLLKQKLLSVSGQTADRARLHQPVTYMYRTSHPMLHFFPQKLAEWIANNYAEELNVPLRPDPTQPWSTATLIKFCRHASSLTGRETTSTPSRQKSLSQTCITGLCAPVVTHSIWNTIDFGEEMSR